MYYKKLTIKNFEHIQEMVVPYILNYIDHNLTEEKLFYNLISDDHLQKFKQDIPELFESIPVSYTHLTLPTNREV